MHIQWFPGHMAKARRVISEHLKLVDAVIELLDARIPESSANPMIQEIVGDKPRVIAFNKADLADPRHTEQWMARFKEQGLPVAAIEAVSGKGLKQLIQYVEQAAAEKMAKWEAKGIKSRPVRAMVLGIPNVGKSSLINRLLGTATVKTANRPGVTRGQQWIKISNRLELLDTPGVLWPKMDDQAVAFKLAVTGAVKDDVYDYDTVLKQLADFLRQEYSDRLTERFSLTEIPADNQELLGLIGAKRGCLKSGGLVDYEKAGKILLQEFRSGKLGKITLDFLL